MNKKDISKIVGILSIGAFCGVSRKGIIVSYVLFAMIWLFIIGISIAILIEEIFEISTAIVPYIVFIVIFVSMLLVIPIGLLTLIIRNEKLRKNVQLWLTDAILLSADTKDFVFPPSNEIGLQVQFKVNGKSYIRYSKNNKKTIGLIFRWKKFANRKINIFYSPTFDQVMLLKDNKIRTK
jgi:hypothetical protein